MPKTPLIRLKLSDDNEISQWGHYGELLLALETGNAIKEYEVLTALEDLEYKTDWLKQILPVDWVLYYMNIGHPHKAQQALDKLDSSLTHNNDADITTIQAWLYIIDNRLDEAKKLLDTLADDDTETEFSINITAYLLDVTQGTQVSSAYLASKLNTHHSKYLKVTYGQYLVKKERELGIDYLVNLSDEYPDDLWVNLNTGINIFHALSAGESQNNLEYFNDIITRVDKHLNANDYIDYPLFNIWTAMDEDISKHWLTEAQLMNPMNIDLLWSEYYFAIGYQNYKQRLTALEKLQQADPNEIYLLIALAEAYSKLGMTEKYLQIKQKFTDSPRHKTPEDIEAMASISTYV